MALQRWTYQEPNRPPASAVSWASSVIDYRACNGAQTGSENGSDHAMVQAGLQLHMKAARISNRPAKLDTKLKTVALNLQNRFVGL